MTEKRTRTQTSTVTQYPDGSSVWKVKLNCPTGRKTLYVVAQSATQAVSGFLEVIGEADRPEVIHSVKRIGCALCQALTTEEPSE